MNMIKYFLKKSKLEISMITKEKSLISLHIQGYMKVPSYKTQQIPLITSSYG